MRKNWLKTTLILSRPAIWLFIVDNIDDEILAGRGEEDIRDFFPRSNQGKILFTIRYRHIAHQFV